MSVIRTGSNTVVATIPVHDFPRGVAFRPRGDFAYVANTASNIVSVISTATNTETTTITVGTGPLGVAVLTR